MKITWNKCFLLSSLLLWTIPNISGFSLNPQPEWSNELNLEEESGIKFRWMNTKPDADGQRWITMLVSAKATGYIGVGFSPNGGMIDGDMAIAWMDSNGKPYIKDFHGLENGPPYEDSSQDYVLDYINEHHGWTTVQFRRLWDTCDSDDFKITNDTMRVIWAYGNRKPEIINGNFRGSYHGTNRGVKSVVITEGAAAPRFPDENPGMFPGVKAFDMKIDSVPITLKDTYYFCKMMKFTDLKKKHHMIGWKPIIQKENRDIVHHMVLFECSVPAEEIPAFDEFAEAHKGGSCYTPNMPPQWGKNCVAFSLIWVTGSEGEMLPQHVGNPLGEMHGGATYFMLEVHYENPSHRITTDSSGIRMFYTDKLREHDGGTILMGYRHSPFLLIPPNQNDFMIHGMCGSECTSKVLPATGIKVTNANVHMHLTGKRIRLRHFREGVELPKIAQDNFYDFNYQMPRTLKEEITIFPGDEFLVECEYQTKDVNRYVIGGLATNQEMCQVFFFYYPRVPLSQCTSQYEFNDFFKGLNIDEIEGERVLKALHLPYEPHLLPPGEREKDLGDDARELEAIEEGISFKSVFNHMNITKPSSLKGKSVGKYLEDIQWTEEMGKRLENFWKEGKHYQFCSKPGLKRVVLDNHVIEYPDIKKAIENESSSFCSRKSDIEKESSTGSNFIASGILTLSFVVVAVLVVVVVGVVLYFKFFH